MKIILKKDEAAWLLSSVRADIRSMKERGLFPVVGDIELDKIAAKIESAIAKAEG